MKIHLEKYNSDWINLFDNLKEELSKHLAPFNPVIEHIESTAVNGLTSKPVIDILVGIKNPDLLESVIAPLIGNGYIYYEHKNYNASMPYRRFFVN